VLGYSALQAGFAFLPVTAVMFAAARLAPRLGPRVGNMRLLAVGVSTALVGMVLLSRITPDSHYFPMIAVPMLLLGTGIGTALTPLTTAGVAGVAPEDAGAASGLVNVAQQLGASLGLGILVTVFAAASHTSARLVARTSAVRAADVALTHGVATALRGSPSSWRWPWWSSSP
jgi:MFS family permease